MTTQKDKQRFVDSGQTIYDMLDEILVVCPKCGSCARITTVEPGNRNLFAPRHLTCLSCAYLQEWAGKEIGRGSSTPVVDDFFGERLWLQAPCGDETLWAYNRRHLGLIEGYVSAKLRERRKRPDLGWQNASLVNRLPKWLSAAKNREAVLRVLQKLKDR